MAGTVFINGTVVPVDAERRIIEDGAVRVVGDRIVAVGPKSEVTVEPDDRVVDCRGKLIIPGLIDAHGHAGHCLIRSIGVDTNPLWMKIVTPVYYHYVTREFWYADGLVSGLERLTAGVTTSVSIITSMPQRRPAIRHQSRPRLWREWPSRNHLHRPRGPALAAHGHALGNRRTRAPQCLL